MPIVDFYTKWSHQQESRKDSADVIRKMIAEDQVAFLESEYGYWDYETKKPIVFESWERELIHRIIKSDKKIRGMGDVKKNRKTTKAAAIAYLVAMKHPGCEIYIVANDLKQAESRAFNYLKNSIDLNPNLDGVKFVGKKIIFPNGSVVEAIPLDWRGEAGSNAFLVVFDEVHGFTSEAAAKLVAEMTIPPSQPNGFQLFTSYAGFEAESEVWESIYKSVFDIDAEGNEVLKPGVLEVQVQVEWENADYKSRNFPLYESAHVLLYWSHGPLRGDPGQQWHTRRWFDQEKATLTTNQFLRLCINLWVSGTEDSVLEDVWGACVAASVVLAGNNEIIPYRIPLVLERNVPLFVGLDGSTKDDHCAVGSVYFHKAMAKLAVGPCKVWKPSTAEPMDLKVVRAYLAWLIQNFWVFGIWVDPYQLHEMITDFKSMGYPMHEFSQTEKNQVPAADNLYNLVHSKNLLVPDDPILRAYANNASAKYKARGWIFQKGKSSKKIDLLVALSMAALKAVENISWLQQSKETGTDVKRKALEEMMYERERQRQEMLGYNLDEITTGVKRNQGAKWGYDKLPDEMFDDPFYE